MDVKKYLIICLVIIELLLIVELADPSFLQSTSAINFDANGKSENHTSQNLIEKNETDSYDPYVKKEPENPFNLGMASQGPLYRELASNKSQYTDGSSAMIPSFYVKTNSYGLREEDFNKSNPEDKTRVVIIGDSLTFGWGVNRSERYTDIVEKRLNKNSEEEFQFINAGNPGYGMRDYYLYLKHRALDYNPDRIILAYSIQDSYSLEKDAEFRRIARNRIPENASNKTEIMISELKDIQVNHMETLDLDNSSFTDNLNRFDNLTKREGIPTTYYAIWELKDNRPWFEDWGERRNRSMIFAPEELEYNPGGHIISKYDVHYDQTGHALVADKMYQRLNEIYEIGREKDPGLLNSLFRTTNSIFT